MVLRVAKNGVIEVVLAAECGGWCPALWGKAGHHVIKPVRALGAYAEQRDLVLNGENRLHDQAKATQNSQQFPVSECLAAGRETDTLRRLLK